MGFIKLDRKITEWEWYSDINTTRLFIHLILRANFRDSKYKGRVIPRGSIATTLPRLAEETALTVKEVRTALNHLKLTGELGIQTTNRESIIKVHNYDVYQSVDNDEGQTAGSQGADEGQTKGKRTEEEGKEGKKEKKDICAFFETVWLLYPVKKGKGQISDAKKRKLYDVGIDQLTRCIERYKANKPDWQAFQNGSTFFNSGYLDYLDENFSAGDQPKNGDRREDGRVYLDGKWVAV